MIQSTLKQKLTQLTSKCDVLVKSGKYPESIDIMEEIVSIKKQIYGIDHLEFNKASEKLCEYLNLAAMMYLQKQKYQLSHDCLKKAELVCKNSLEFKSTTYNNLACYYRKTGKIRTALVYLIQALQLQLKLDQPKTLPDTHLNLCAVLSQLNRHQDALQHAMLSIIMLQDQFLQICLPNHFINNHQNISDQRLAVLAIAYHNLGVEFEHLKRVSYFLKQFEEAVKIYKKALKISKDYISGNQQLIQNLSQVVASATQQIKSQKKNQIKSRKDKYNREISQNKKDLYRDLSKNTQRLKNLPKFRINTGNFSKEIKSSIDPLNRTSLDYKHSIEIRSSTDIDKLSKSFATRKNPRYYKSFAIPSSSYQPIIKMNDGPTQSHFETESQSKFTSFAGP